MFRNICLFVSVLSSLGSLIKRILSAMFFLYFFKLYLSAKGSSLQILCELLWIYLYLRNYDTLKCLTEERIGGGILFFLNLLTSPMLLRPPILFYFEFFPVTPPNFMKNTSKKYQVSISFTLFSSGLYSTELLNIWNKTWEENVHCNTLI